MPNSRTGADTQAPKIDKKTVHAVASSSLPKVPAILLRIGGCESGGGVNNSPRQFNKDGSVVRGKVNRLDIGAYQINLYWNGAKAKELGYDLFTEEGNTKMALWLYGHQGTQPWSWSKPCWR